MTYITLKEATRRLAVSRATLYRWAEAGRITLYKLGPRATRVKLEELERLVTEARPLYGDGDREDETLSAEDLAAVRRGLEDVQAGRCVTLREYDQGKRP